MTLAITGVAPPARLLLFIPTWGLLVCHWSHQIQSEIFTGLIFCGLQPSRGASCTRARVCSPDRSRRAQQSRGPSHTAGSTLRRGSRRAPPDVAPEGTAWSDDIAAVVSVSRTNASSYRSSRSPGGNVSRQRRLSSRPHSACFLRAGSALNDSAH